MKVKGPACSVAVVGSTSAAKEVSIVGGCAGGVVREWYGSS